MTKDLIREFGSACANGTIYDFIANHYWELSKEELRDIAEELAFVATDDLSNEETAKFTKEVCQSLEDNTNCLEADED